MKRHYAKAQLPRWLDHPRAHALRMLGELTFRPPPCPLLRCTPAPSTKSPPIKVECPGWRSCFHPPHALYLFR